MCLGLNVSVTHTLIWPHVLGTGVEFHLFKYALFVVHVVQWTFAVFFLIFHWGRVSVVSVSWCMNALCACVAMVTSYYYVCANNSQEQETALTCYSEMRIWNVALKKLKIKKKKALKTQREIGCCCDLMPWKLFFRAVSTGVTSNHSNSEVISLLESVTWPEV